MIQCSFSSNIIVSLRERHLVWAWLLPRLPQHGQNIFPATWHSDVSRDCPHGNFPEFSHGKPFECPMIFPWDSCEDSPHWSLQRQVSNTALTARECLRVMARSNPSQAVPVVLEAPGCSRFEGYFLRWFNGDLIGFHGDLIGFNGDLIGFNGDLTANNGDLIAFNGNLIGFNRI